MRKKINYRKIIILLLIVYCVITFISQSMSMRRISGDIHKEVTKANNLKEEQKVLSNKVEMAKTDKYKEILARERLNLVKEGETPVIDSQEQ